jgi:hypothetical protein
MLDLIKLSALGALFSFIFLPIVGVLSAFLLILLIGICKELVYEVSTDFCADFFEAAAFILGGITGILMYFLIKIIIF